jgi:hypothetical protein
MRRRSAAAAAGASAGTMREGYLRTVCAAGKVSTMR